MKFTRSLLNCLRGATIKSQQAHRLEANISETLNDLLLVQQNTSEVTTILVVLIHWLIPFQKLLANNSVFWRETRDQLISWAQSRQRRV